MVFAFILSPKVLVKGAHFGENIRVGFRPFAVAGPSARNSLSNPVRNPNATEAAFGACERRFLFAH